MRPVVFIVALCMTATTQGRAQTCPAENPNGPNVESISKTLSGRVVYHDEIRKWFGLQLDRPVCGVKEIQLLQGGGAFEVNESNAYSLEVFRGCKVTVKGPLGIPGTGYYSANLYQNADTLAPERDCVLKAHLPDYSKSKPKSSIRRYLVSMRIDYNARGGHIDIRANSGERRLRPWQAYASYWLTGGYVFYAHCADGFEIGKFKGTPAAKPWLIDNEIAMDPESAAAKHIDRIELAYTCRRESGKVSP